MSSIAPISVLPSTVHGEPNASDAEIAAAAFLARYSGRTLDAYRHDLRTFFQWSEDVGLAVLDATRAHIELYRSTLEERHLGAATIDRRLSTVCGFYRFAHIDGRVSANPAQYVRRPTVYPNDTAGMDRAALGTFLSRPNISITRTPRSPSCLASTAYACPRHARRTSKNSRSNAGTARSASSERAINRPSSRSFRAPLERSISQSANDTMVRSCGDETGSVLIVAPHTDGYVRSAAAPASEQCIPICCARRSSWPRSTPASRYVTFRSPPDTPTRARQRSTTDAVKTSTATPHTS